MISTWLYVIGGVLSIWGIALHGSELGLTVGIAGLAITAAALLNEVWWHVTEIRVISVFPVHIIVKQEWWE